MSKNTDESLNQMFEIDETTITSVSVANLENAIVTVDNNRPIIQATPIIEHDAEDEDFEEIRSNLKSLVRKGNKMLDNLLEIAESSERDRTYEVAGEILKKLSDINKDILNIRKTQKENKELGKHTSDKDLNDGGSINIDKAVFVGTTADLLKQIKEQRNNNG